MKMTNRKHLMLLVQLRWLAVVGQVATILIVYYGIGIPLLPEPMAAIVLLIHLSGATLARLRKDTPISIAGLFMAGARRGGSHRPALSQRRRGQPLRAALRPANIARGNASSMPARHGRSSCWRASPFWS